MRCLSVLISIAAEAIRRILPPVWIRRAMPVVRAADGAEARSFYVDVLGFRVAMEQDGMLMLASRTVPTTQLVVAWPSPTAFDPDVLLLDMTVEVADVDFVYAKARERGLEIVRELRDEPWGIRRFF